MQNQKSKLGLRDWEKWLLMSIIITCLASIVIYFNLMVYGLVDGASYIGVVLFIVVLTFVVTRHIKRNPVTSSFLVAAFVFEVLLALALGVNAGYSLSVQREMGIAGADMAERKAIIEAAGKLRGSRNQKQALELAGANNKSQSIQTRAQVFAEHERNLWIILMSELGVAILATFVLLGLSVFDKNLDGIPDVFQRSDPRPPVRPLSEMHRDVQRAFHAGDDRTLTRFMNKGLITSDEYEELSGRLMRAREAKVSSPDRQLSNGKDRKFDSH